MECKLSPGYYVRLSAIGIILGFDLTYAKGAGGGGGGGGIA